MKILDLLVSNCMVTNMLNKSKYDNIISFDEGDIISLLSMHHGVTDEDIELRILIDTEGKPYIEGEIGIVEPEREISFTDHY